MSRGLTSSIRECKIEEHLRRFVTHEFKSAATLVSLCQAVSFDIEAHDIK